MASVGPNYPASGASLANAGTSENANPWTTPGNVGSSSAVASITAATFDSPDISEILVASNFGFNLGANDVIKGIVVEISKRGYTSTNSGMDFRVQLAHGTTFADLAGTNKASGSVWPQNTLATTTYGSASDTWSAGLTPADVNSSSFAVFLSAYANVANADIDVDWIRVTITYVTNYTIAPSAISSAQVVSNPKVIGPQYVGPSGITAPGGGAAYNNIYSSDLFDSGDQSGWGTADVGGAWTQLGSSDGTVSILNGKGRMAFTTNGQSAQKQAIDVQDVDITVDVVATWDPGVSGDAGATDIYLRQTASSTNGNLSVELGYSPIDNLMRWMWLKEYRDGSFTIAQANLTALPYAATDTIHIRVQAIGNAFKAKYWRNSELEPTAWTVEGTTSYTISGYVVLQAWFDGGSSTLQTTDFDNWLVTDPRTDAASLGTPTVTLGAPPSGGATIAPSGITSGAALGLPVLKAGTITALPTGIASAESLGTAVLLHGGITISPSAISSGEAVGSASLLHGGVIISPSAISSGEALGSPTAGTIAPARTIQPTSIVGLASYQATVLADNPLGYWRLGEPSGTLADNVGSGGATYDGSYVNTPALGVAGALTGDTDTAVGLTAAQNEYITGAGLPVGYGDVSVEVWAKLTAGVAEFLWDSVNTGWNGGTQLSYGIAQSNTLSFGLVGFNYWSMYTIAPDNAYHHIVGTVDRDGNQYLYVDGQQVGDIINVSAAAGYDIPTSEAFYIGTYSQLNYFFNSSIDEVAYYRTALTPAQVAAHYAAGLGTAATGPGTPALLPGRVKLQPRAIADQVAYANKIIADRPRSYWRLGDKAITPEAPCGAWCANISTHWNSTIASGGSTALDPDVHFPGDVASIKIVATSSGPTYIASSQTQDGAPAVRLERFRFRMENLPDTGGYEAQIATIWSAGWNLYLVWDEATGRLALWRQGDWNARQVGGPVIEVGVWYTIEFGASVGTAPGVGFWSIDEERQPDISMGNATPTVMSLLYFGQRYGEHNYSNYTLHIANVVGSIVLADFPIGGGSVKWNGASEYWSGAADEVGTADGAYVNAPTVGVAGALIADSNAAVTFNGTNQTITVADSSPFRGAGRVPFSIEAWFKHTATTAYRQIASCDNAGNGWELYHYSNGGSSSDFGFQRRGYAAIQGAPAALDSNWHHVVGTYDGTFINCYLDGTLIAGPVSDTASLPSDTTFVIGGPDVLWNGTIDEVAFYDYALTAEQVAAHYAVGLLTLPVGTPTASRAAGSITIAPTGIASGEAVGSATVAHGPVAISTPGIPTAEAIGSITVSQGGIQLLPAGIASTQVLGSPTLLRGSVTVAPSSISTAEAVGNPGLAASAVILPTAIVSGEFVGSGSLTTAARVIPSAIASAESVGTAVLTTGGVVVAPTGITSREALGTLVQVDLGEAAPRFIQVTGISSAQALGAPILQQAGGPSIIQPSGVTSAEAIGTSTLLTGNVIILPAGIGTAQAVSTATAVAGGVTIAPSGVTSAVVIGTATIVAGAISVAPAAIVSNELVSTPTLAVGNVNIAPAGIGSAQAVSNPTITTSSSPLTIAPVAITSGETFGSPLILSGALTIGTPAIGTGESLGTPSITLGPAAIVPQGVPTGENVGSPRLITATQILGTGIATGELFGSPLVIRASLDRVVAPTGITTSELFGLPLLIPGKTFIQVTGIASGERIGISILRSSKSGWQWVNRSPMMAGVHEGRWPQLQDGFARTRKDEGESG